MLKKALLRAERSLQASYFVLLNSIFNPQTTEINTLLQEQQSNVLTTANLFVPAVITLEKSNFNDKYQCQNTPWKAVIPLFETGYLAAEQAKQALKNASIAASQQEQTIVSWQRILPLLDQASSSRSTITQPPSASSKNVQNILNLIQDMQAEDTPVQPQGPKEMHAW